MKNHRLFLRALTMGAASLAVAIAGLVITDGSASAHTNAVTGVVSCLPTATSASYEITWTVANDYDLSETVTVTAASGQVTSTTVANVVPTSAPIAASPSVPYSTATFVQTVPGSTTGAATITVRGLWSDGFTRLDTGTVALPGGCDALPPTTQSITGHIYLCATGTPTTTGAPGGSLGATGPQAVDVGTSPLAPTGVLAGTYTMTATPPGGYTLVACGGSAVPAPGGGSATETVTVPSGGTGAGVFYVQLDATPTTASNSTGTATTAIPLGAPQTGFGGASHTGANALMVAVGGLAILGAGLAILFLIRRRRLSLRAVPVDHSGVGDDR